MAQQPNVLPPVFLHLNGIVHVTLSDIGTVYVLASRDSSLCKLGFTRTGTPELRAASYERAHGIQWTRVFWSAVTCDVARIEARIHRELAPYRFALSPPGAVEIYHLIPQHAVRIAERYIVAPRGAAPHPSQGPQPAMNTSRGAWPTYAGIIWSVASLIFAQSHGVRRRNRYLRTLLRGLRAVLR